MKINDNAPKVQLEKTCSHATDIIPEYNQIVYSKEVVDKLISHLRAIEFHCLNLKSENEDYVKIDDVLEVIEIALKGD